MAKLEGISGIQIGDGSSGKVALAIQTGVLRILKEDGSFAYKTATIMNKGQVKAGSVTYQVPELVQAEDYGTGTSAFQTLNSGLVTVPINTRRTIKYTYETFDASRLGDMEYLIGIIAQSMSTTILYDLNAHFFAFLVEKFELTNGALRTQNITLPNLVQEGKTSEEIRDSIYKLQRLTVQISKKFDKKQYGVAKSELMVFLDPMADVNIRQAYWNQPNSLGERVVAKDLVGTQLGGGIYYYLDSLLGNKIDRGTAFSKDKDLDTTKFVGFVIHNEAIAMPFNLQSINQVVDQDNANPRFIAKYQFGTGMLRPHLVYSITTETPTPTRAK